VTISGSGDCPAKHRVSFKLKDWNGATRFTPAPKRSRLGIAHPNSAPKVMASDGDYALRSVTRIASFRRFGLKRRGPKGDSRRYRKQPNNARS